MAKITKLSIEHRNKDFDPNLKKLKGMTIPKKLLVNAVKVSEKTNSAETTMSFHNCGDLDGWCVVLKVMKHSVCEEQEENA